MALAHCAAQKGLERAGDVRDHRIISLRRDIDAAELLGERDDADLQRRPQTDVDLLRCSRAPTRRIKPDQLRGTTADIEDKYAFRLRIREGRAAKRGESRFRLPVDDFEFEAERIVHPVEELVAVGSHAAGFCRDQARSRDAPLLHFGPAHGERVERADDGRLAELARLLQALAKPHDAGKRIDNAQAVGAVTRAVMMRPRHEQPAIVGAEIERRVGVAVVRLKG